MSQISPYLNQIVQWEAQAGFGQDSKPKYLPPVPLRGRSEGSLRMMFNGEGEQVLTATKIWLEPTATVKQRDRINGFVVHMLDSQQGLSRPSHLVAYLGGG